MSETQPMSLWDASAQEADYQKELDGDIRVDVAIVGGGFTGLSTALHCAQLGFSAHILEAKHIGYGGSGRNVGLVNAGVWLPPQKVREQLGDARGSEFVKSFGEAPEYVFSLIEKNQIQCEVTKTGTIHAAHSSTGFKDLEGRAKEWHRLGQPVELLDQTEASKLIGSDAFYGGLVDKRAGTVNPMGYCRGLARVALSHGAEISTGVKATGLKKVSGKWTIETERGLVTADAVILGTNAYTDDLFPDLKRTYTMIHYFQLATKPLGPEAAHILPNKQGLWDTGQIMFSVRRDAFDRLIIGSMGTVVGDTEKGLSQRWARKQIARIFPTLGPVEFEEAWHGQIAMTPDHLPRIYELDDRLYTPIGYNGRGITTGTIFGRAMADILTGADENSLPLPITKLSTIKSAPLMSRLYQTAFTANQIMKSI